MQDGTKNVTQQLFIKKYFVVFNSQFFQNIQSKMIKRGNKLESLMHSTQQMEQILQSRMAFIHCFLQLNINIMILNPKYMFQQSQRTLIDILNKSAHENIYEKALIIGSTQYQLNPYNIMKLAPTKVLQIFRSVQKKFSHQNQDYEIQYWYENQLRIFVWVIIVYAYINKKNIEHMDPQDWDRMSQIFHDKTPIALYQTKKFKKWSNQQVKLLENIIKDKIQKNHWNQIAKQIFIRSNKEFFRTPKQCREQWLNHLDPSKIKSQWNIVEDYELIKSIIKNGKKWSKVAKQIGNHRTQHMVKNRYKSMINAEMKRIVNIDMQQKIVLKIKHRLQNNALIKKHISGSFQKNNLKQQKSTTKSSLNIVQQIFNQLPSFQKIKEIQQYNFESQGLSQQNLLFFQRACQEKRNEGALQKSKQKNQNQIQAEQRSINEEVQLGQVTNLNQFLFFEENNFNFLQKAPFLNF